MAATLASTPRPLFLPTSSCRHRHCSFVFPSTLNPSWPPPPLLRSSSPLAATLPSLRRRRSTVVASAQSNLLKVIQTAWRVGKDGIEAGTNLVPDSVPRPIAKISIAVVAATVGLFLLKSVISTAFFVLAMMGFIYFMYIAFNKDEGPKSGGGGSRRSGPATDDEALDEVRRIMDKYK